MGYSIQNNETGEVDYIQSSDEHVYQQEPLFDQETGEPLNGAREEIRIVKHKSFQIPKKYLRGTLLDEAEKEQQEQVETPSCVFSDAAGPKPKTSYYKKQDYINMEGVQNDIILGYNKKNYRLLLIPSIFCFNIYMAAFVLVLELLLHLISHCKNRLTMNKNIYYRSPLHVLTSQYCALCRAESEVDFNIFNMLNKQMRQAHEALKFKDVSKAIS